MHKSGILSACILALFAVLLYTGCGAETTPETEPVAGAQKTAEDSLSPEQPAKEGVEKKIIDLDDAEWEEFKVPEPGDVVKHYDAFPAEGLVKGRAEDFESTIVTPHLREEIPGGKNIIWCATFQIAWNSLIKLNQGEIEIENAPDYASPLNKREVTREDIDEESHIALAGWVSDGIQEKVKDALAKKFGAAATPAFGVLDRPLPVDGWLTYCYLFKNLSFEHTFKAEDYMKIDFGGTEVPAFGILNYADIVEDIGKQVRIFDYRSKDEFIVELVTTSDEDRLILAKIEPARTLLETINEVNSRMSENEPESMKYKDNLQIPKINLEIVREYSELYGKRINSLNRRVDGTVFIEAFQLIRFQLDEGGAMLFSIGYGCGGIVEQKDMFFNKPFLLMLKRKGREMPYFALWVDNAEILVKE